MDLLAHLKQFKRIQPDRGKAALARAHILSQSQKRRYAWTGVFARAPRPVLVFAAVLLVFGGGFYSLRYFKNKVALNPQSLQAEAQAIDIQIDLANLQYQNVPGVKAQLRLKSVSLQSAATSTPATSTSTPEMTIDQALNALSSM